MPFNREAFENEFRELRLPDNFFDLSVNEKAALLVARNGCDKETALQSAIVIDALREKMDHGQRLEAERQKAGVFGRIRLWWIWRRHLHQFKKDELDRFIEDNDGRLKAKGRMKRG